jgi:hypothetical protein
VCKTSLYLSSAFVSAERLRIGLNLDTLIAMAPKKRANETTAPPWTQAKTDWQQLQTRRLEQMRAQFPATEPPSGRKYDQYSDIESHATVSLSPLDALLEKRKALLPVPEGDASMRAMEHCRRGEEGLRATGFKPERHSHMILGRPVQAFSFSVLCFETV